MTEITEREVGSVTVLQVRGRLVYDFSDELDEKLRSLLAAGRVKLLLHCQAVTAIDSHALGMLARCAGEAANQGGRLKLLKPSTRVQQGLSMVGLVKIIEVFDDESVAIESFA